MDTAFPFGTYSFQTNTGLTAALNYLLDAYTSDIPALDAATFNALQGMNPSQPFTFHFNSFTPSANASSAATFLTVFGSSFGAGGLSPASTSAPMPANTLLPNTTYQYELDFSDRVSGSDPNSGVPTLIGFDVRTDGTFTTGTVPEASSMVPLAAAFLGFAALRLRRKAR